MKLKKIHIFLIVLFALTLFLRLYWIDTTILDSDMFRDLTNAQEVANGKIRFIGVAEGLGQDSVKQQTFGPLMFYMIAPFLRDSYNILLVPIFVAILNSIAVVITFFFVKKYFGEKTAIVASLLFAVNPWHVFLSTFFWNPNFLPFFSIVFFYFLFTYVIDKRDYSLALAALILSLMLHFHLTPLAFVPVLIISILIFRRDTKFKYYIYSAALFLFPFMPYIYYNLKNRISLFFPFLYAGEKAGLSFFESFSQSFGIPVMLSTNYFGKYIYGASDIFGSLFLKYLFFLLTIFLVLSFFAAIVYIYLKIRNYKMFKLNPKYSLLFLLLFVPSFLQFIRFANVSPHYYFMIYPIQLIIPALFFVFLYNKFTHKFLFFVFFACLLVLLIFNSFLLFAYMEKHGTTEDGAFSLTYGSKLEVLDYIDRDSNGQATIIFYKRDKAFRYIFKKLKPNFKLLTLDSLSQLNWVHGYLIFDRVSMHKTILTSDEVKYFDSLNKSVIKNIEIYEI